MAKWAQAATKRMEEKGTKGKFTRWANRHGYDSPLAAARHVMAHKGKYSSSVVKEANFARNINE
jgi:ribosomal protein S4